MKRTLCIMLAAVLVLISPGCRLINKLASPPVYKVTFDPNGGELVSGELTQNIGAGHDAVPPEVSREGYEFDGWDGSLVNISSNTAVKAGWIRLYSVSFDPDGGELEGPDTLTVREGAVPEAPAVSREGCSFLGWEPELAPAEEDASYKALWQKNKLSAEEIYARISPSVIEVHVQTTWGYESQGSGFFIDEKGRALTNYHVMEGAKRAWIILPNGSMRDVRGVVAYNETSDLCVIKVDMTGTVPVPIAEEPVVTGQTVYTVGNPLGLSSTITSGIVSAADRFINGVHCIQISAPISRGNSGGPLVNEYGEAVGVNSMTMSGGQNLNFAVNISYLNSLDLSSMLLMDDFLRFSMKGFYGAYLLREDEPNDTLMVCDVAEQGAFTAAELSRVSDTDWFGLFVYKDGKYDLRIRLFDSAGSLTVTFFKLDLRHIESVDDYEDIADSLEAVHAEFTEETVEGYKELTARVRLDEEMIYFICVTASDSAEQTFPVYYAVTYNAV